MKFKYALSQLIAIPTVVSLIVLGLTASPAQAGMGSPMLLMATTHEDGQWITLPLFGSVTATITWGDGGAAEDVASQGHVWHQYATPGDHYISIFGTVTHYGQSDCWDNTWLTQVIEWGTTGLTSLESAFCGADNLALIPPDLPAAVTDLRGAFKDADGFTADITDWNTANVTRMDYLFSDSDEFNQDIGAWNVSSVTDMTGMFNGAIVFNQDISGWNVSKVTGFNNMFQGTMEFNQDIGDWDVSSATDLGWMFAYTSAFNQDIGGWDVSNVTSVRDMFSHATEFNQDISSWDISSLTSLIELFWGATSFNQDLSAWDVSKITNFGSTFAGATSFNQPLQDWDTSSATWIGEMFYGATSFNQPLVQSETGWNVSNVTSFMRVFAGASSFNQSVSSWPTGDVPSFYEMFKGATAFNQPLPEVTGKWDMSAAIDLYGMFDGATSFDQDLSSWDVSQVTDLSYTFANGGFNHDLSAWDVSAVTTMVGTFAGSKAFNQSIDDWNTASLTDITSMFEGSEVFNEPIVQSTGHWDVSQVTSAQHLFKGAVAFNQSIDTWDTSHFTSFYEMFANTGAFNQPLADLDYSGAWGMDSMFAGAQAFNQDLSGWDVSQFSGMSEVFARTKVFNGDISNWDTSNFYYLTGMFHGAEAFNQPIENWDVSKVRSFSSVFEDAESFNQPVFLWDLSSARNLSKMFKGATSFNMPGESGQIPYVENMEEMFTNSGLSDANYSSWLERFANDYTAIPNNLSLGASAKYLCGSASSRDKLVGKNWSITDGGAADCKTAQWIDFPQPKSIPVLKTRVLGATATSNLAVTFKLISGPCTLSGKILTSTGLGVCVIAAQQVGDGTYSDSVDELLWITSVDLPGFSLNYEDNGATSGLVEDVASPYFTEEVATVASGAGLVRSGYAFTGWNTAANGSGTSYAAGDTITIAESDVTLYAQWKATAAPVSRKLIVKFTALSSKLSTAAKFALRSYYKKYLSGHSHGLTLTVTGFVQRTSSARNDLALSRARAVSVVRYLKALGLKANFKIVAGGSRLGTSSGARKAYLLASWGK